MNIKVIAFDADDTLWDNEPKFQSTEHRFCELMSDILPQEEVSKELLKTEISNIALYGYGVKGFMLSMIETALRISDRRVSPERIGRIIELGKDLLNMPVVVLPGIEDALNALKGRYRLVVATKGDLLDQERKLVQSGLQHYFHHIEVMSEKHERDYLKLIKHLDIQPSEFLMIGNSLKSDIIPVLNLGGHAFHIPYHTNWAHDLTTDTVEHPNFRCFGCIQEIFEAV